MEAQNSLAIIEGMLGEARKSLHRISPYFLIWGVILALAGMGESILVFQLGIKQGYFVWMVLPVIGGVVSTIYSRKEAKRQQTKSHYDTVYMYLWGAFGTSMMLVLVMCSLIKVAPTPFIMVLTGMATLITGGIIKFKPFVFGGIIFWALAIVALLVDKSFTGYVFSLSVVLGYLIPGFYLFKNEKANQ